MAQTDVELGAADRSQADRVELLAHRQVAGPVRQAQRAGAGGGGEVEQVGRGQRQPVGTEQPLHEVRLQPLLEQREAGAGADVGAEGDRDTVVDVPGQGEQPAAER